KLIELGFSWDLNESQASGSLRIKRKERLSNRVGSQSGRRDICSRLGDLPCRWRGCNIRIFKAEPLPFVEHQEEGLIFDDRTAQKTAILVVLQRRPTIINDARVAKR